MQRSFFKYFQTIGYQYHIVKQAKAWHSGINTYLRVKGD